MLVPVTQANSAKTPAEGKLFRFKVNNEGTINSVTSCSTTVRWSGSLSQRTAELLLTLPSITLVAQ